MNNINSLRKEKNMSMKELATAIGVTEATISRWENEKTNPRMGQVQKMADYFGVTKSYLLGYSNNKFDQTQQHTDKLSSAISDTRKYADKIKKYKNIYTNLKQEQEHFSKTAFKTLDNSMLLKFIPEYDIEIIDNPLNHIDTINEYYEKTLIEIAIKIEMYEDFYKNARESAEMYQELLDGTRFFIQDRINPDFEKNGQSQSDLASRFKTIPYIFSYEATMKIYEYANMLYEKDENKFNPPN